MLDDITKYHPDWWADSKCSTSGLEIFFGSDDSHTSLKKAREFCGTCPVSQECLTHALTIPEEYGIWAGTSARNRLSMLEEISRGTPIKTVVTTVINNSFRWKRKK